MNIGARMRVLLARRPWIFWSVVVVLIAVVVSDVTGRLRSLDEARARWERTERVLVASRPLRPGDPVVADVVDLPAAAVPADAVAADPAPRIARQHVAVGEVIVTVDVDVGTGPAAGAEDGQVVVPVIDPVVPSAPVGVEVMVLSEGVVLAERARVVEADGEVVYVAVERSDAPVVAAAARLGAATIAFIR